MKIPHLPLIAMLLFSAVAFTPHRASAQTVPTETGPGWIWWEGEDATETDLSTQFGFAPQGEEQAKVLSGGKWLGSSEKEFSEGRSATYRVEIPESGEYFFYARRLGSHGPFRWRFDDQGWQEVTRDNNNIDSVTMRKFIPASWVLAGKTELDKGEHTLRIELTEYKNGYAAFDAFLLSQSFITPAGTRRPGEKYGTAPEGWFAFEPDMDRYTDDAMLDLTSLTADDIERLGFIDREGDRFVYRDSGRPVRLWSLNSGMALPTAPRPVIDEWVKFVAKRGINCVRLHGGWFYGSGPEASRVDPQKQDNAFYFIAKLKEAGIYVSISPYFQHWLDLSEDQDFPGYENIQNGRPFVLHFFYDKYQERMKDWYRAILDTENPYTGKKLADDPVVATFEFINEDNFFFWTWQAPEKVLPEPYLHELEKQFGAWLTEKYGSLEKAYEAWGDNPTQGLTSGDHFEEGRAALYGVWTMSAEGAKRRNKERARDCAEFLTQTMRDFYQEMIDFVSNEIGYDGLFNSTSFAVADPKIMTGLTRLAQSPLDVTDYHGHYRGAMDKGGSWQTGEGTTYYDRSVLRLMDKEGNTGAGIDSVMHRVHNDGKPLIHTEFSYMLPNRFHTELPATMAIFGREGGYSQVSFFASEPKPGFMSALTDFFDTQTPGIAAQWPATAILYRSDLLKEGDVLVQETVSPETLYNLEGTKIVPPMFIDELGAAALGKSADADVFSNDAVLEQFGFNPRAFLLGQIHINFEENAEHKLEISDRLDSLISGNEHGMQSSSGNFIWNTRQGLLRLQAPGGQGVVGFLNEAPTIELPDLTISSGMPFGSILAVAMDQKPLKESGKILLQVMSEIQNYGARATPEEGKRTIKSMGKAPIIVREFQGSVSFNIPNADTAKVTMLDPNGYPTDTFTGATKIQLKPNVLYYIIER